MPAALPVASHYEMQYTCSISWAVAARQIMVSGTPEGVSPMLYILDGYALAYRHFFAQAQNRLATASGEPMKA